MSLFRVSSHGLVPFRRVGSDDDGRDTAVGSALAKAIWRDLDAVTGDRLFAICPELSFRGRPERLPAMIALDLQGNVVIIYVRPVLDRDALAECLESVGWARTTTISELADRYSDGGEEFWRGWQRFAGSAAPPTVSRQPRLVIVSSEISRAANGALEFLVENSLPVSVLRANLFMGADGEEILQILQRGRAPEPSRGNGRREVPSPAGANGHRLNGSAVKPEQLTRQRSATEGLDTTQIDKGLDQPTLDRPTAPRPSAASESRVPPRPSHTPESQSLPIRPLASNPNTERIRDPLTRDEPRGERHEERTASAPTTSASEARPVSAIPISAAPISTSPASSGPAGRRESAEQRPLDPLSDTLVRVAASNGTRLTGTPVGETSLRGPMPSPGRSVSQSASDRPSPTSHDRTGSDNAPSDEFGSRRPVPSHNGGHSVESGLAESSHGEQHRAENATTQQPERRTIEQPVPTRSASELAWEHDARW